MDLLIQIAATADTGQGAHAGGVRLVDASTARPIHEAGYPVEAASTPLAAHYQALVYALRLAVPLEPSHVDLRCGSRDLVEQVTGAGPLEEEDLQSLYQQALQQLIRLDSWRIGAAEASENRRPAELARDALSRGETVVELDHATAQRQHSVEHTGVPQWTAELMEEPGGDCPAGCSAGVRHAFGPDTPAGFCVHAARVALLDGPLGWQDDAQQQMTTSCPRCDVPVRLVRAS